MAFPLKHGLAISLFLALLLSGCRTPTPLPNPLQNSPTPEPLARGYQDDSTGLSFPPKIGDLALQAITDYESTTPGLGTGLSYRGLATKLEIFIYTNGASLVPSGVDPPIVQEAFAKAIGDIEQASEEGRYDNYAFLSHRVKDMGGQLFLKALFSYSEQVATKHSILYATGFNTRIVKIRLTTQFDRKSKVEDRIRLVEDDLASIFSRGLRKGLIGITHSQALALQQETSLIDLSDGLSQAEAVIIAQLELINRDLAGKWNILSWMRSPAVANPSISLIFPPLERSKTGTSRNLTITVHASGRTEIEDVSNK